MVAVALAPAAAFEHIRVRGGIQRTKRKAKRRPFQLQLTALAINGTKQRTPEPAQEREAPELTALPTEPVYPAEQATRSPKPASTRALLSVQAVCIPGCNGAGRRFRQNRPQQRKKGSGRNTQLRSFSLHALLPAAQPTLSASISAASGPSATGSGQASLGTPVSARLGADQAGAAGAPSSPHSNRAPLDPSAYTQTPGAGLTFNLSATPRPPSAFPSPAPSAAGTPASASLHNITKTPSVSSLRLRGTPMEGVPERPASAAGLRPLCAPTSTVKPGSLVTCQWLSPIEGLHEMRGLGPLSSFSSGRARSTGRRQSLSRFSVGTPMEGVPERSLPPAPTPSVARSLQQGLLWQQDSSGLRTGSGSVGTDARQATASAAAAAPLGRPVHNVGVQAASLGENAPSDGAFAHEGLPARREAQVQTSVGLTVRARARAAQDAPLSLTPLLLASQGGQPAAAAGGAAAGALQDEDVGGFVSISSTPAAMQTLDGASRPPSALPTPVTMVLQPAAQAAAAGGGTPALAGAAMDTPGLLDDTPGLGPMDGQTGPGVSGLWPASLPRSVRGPVSYGDDPADELPQGGHITSLIDPPEPYDEDPSDDGYQSEGESEGEGAQRPGVVGAAGRSSGTLDTLRPREGAGRVTEPGRAKAAGKASPIAKAGSSQRPVIDGASDSDNEGGDMGSQESEGGEGESESDKENAGRDTNRGAVQQARVGAKAGGKGHGSAGQGKKDKDRRKSLAGAGLQEDEHGVRRSSRARIKPLQYWRNEHKVYARNHRTMPTVVAVETRTPNMAWPAVSTGHEAKKKMRARTRAALHDKDGDSPSKARRDRAGARVQDWDEDD